MSEIEGVDVAAGFVVRVGVIVSVGFGVEAEESVKCGVSVGAEPVQPIPPKISRTSVVRMNDRCGTSISDTQNNLIIVQVIYLDRATIVNLVNIIQP